MAHGLEEMAHSRRLVAAPSQKFGGGDIFPLGLRFGVQVRRMIVDRMQIPLRSLTELGGASQAGSLLGSGQLRALAEESLSPLDSKYTPRMFVEY